MLPKPQSIVDRLVSFQITLRQMVMRSHSDARISEVSRSSSADTIYKIDEEVEPMLVEFCEQWGRDLPLVLVAEGLEDERGAEAEYRVFPHGTSADDAAIRLIVDPIDGTRGIMYDKRPAWALAGVAPNKGPATRLRDIEAAVMTELPTSKMGFADVLWAVKGLPAQGQRHDLHSGDRQPLQLAPSTAATIDHGFASVANFFPGTKVLAADVMEHLVARLIGPADVTRATVFEDQYIATGGQFYELIVGHDRFTADLRPLFYQIQNQPQGLCCHPYDCATWLIAEQAGVILTDARGNPLDGPLDVTTGIAWAGFANAKLCKAIEPVLRDYLTAALAQHRAPGC
jgi:fructose-1,6-bisphosphatase/inositol monophosphatase family enzyme